MNIFKTLYRRFVPAPTVASVMSGFTKSINKLDAIQEECSEQAYAIDSQIDALVERGKEVNLEGRAAGRAAAKLRAFLD